MTRPTLGAIDSLTQDERQELAGRAMVVRRAEVLPMECVVRGYLYGSAWREYSSGGGPATEHLPGGLERASRLDRSRSSHRRARRTAATTRTSPSRGQTARRERRLRTAAAAVFDIYPGQPISLRAGRVLGRHQVRVRDDRRSDRAGRRGVSHPTHHGTGRPTSGNPAERCRASTNSTCGTGSTRPGGTTNRPHPELPPDVVQGTRSRYVEAYELITQLDFGRYLEGDTP